jgi:hypothetical protein
MRPVQRHRPDQRPQNPPGTELSERLSGRSVRLSQVRQRFLPYAEQLLSPADEAAVRPGAAVRPAPM